MNGKKATPAGADNTAPAKAGHEEAKAIARANGLKSFWQDAAGAYHFDAAYVATLAPSTLTVISVD